MQALVASSVEVLRETVHQTVRTVCGGRGRDVFFNRLISVHFSQNWALLMSGLMSPKYEFAQYNLLKRRKISMALLLYNLNNKSFWRWVVNGKIVFGNISSKTDAFSYNYEGFYRRKILYFFSHRTTLFIQVSGIEEHRQESEVRSYIRSCDQLIP